MITLLRTCSAVQQLPGAVGKPNSSRLEINENLRRSVRARANPFRMGRENLPQAQDVRSSCDADTSSGHEAGAVESRPILELAGLDLSPLASASARQNRGVSTRSPRVLEASGDSRTGSVGVAASNNELQGPKMRSHMEPADLPLSPAAGPRRGSRTRQSQEEGNQSPRAQQSPLAAQRYTQDGLNVETQDTPCGTTGANDVESPLRLDDAAATRVDSDQQGEATAPAMLAHEAKQDLGESRAPSPSAASAGNADRANSNASEQPPAAEDLELPIYEGEQTDDRIMEQLRNTSLLRCLSSVDIEAAVKRAAITTYRAGDVILDSLSHSDKVYVILEGEVDVMKQRPSSGEPSTSAASVIVTTLHTGDYFNDMPEDPSHAGNAYAAKATEGADEIRVLALDARVLALEAEEAMQRIGLEDVSLSEDSASVNMRTDLEAQSLNEHVDQYLQLVERSGAFRAKEHRPRGGLVSLFERRRSSRLSERGSEDKALLTALMTAFSPELGLDDVIERIVAVTSDVFQFARVGLFLVDYANNCLILKVSQHSRGITVPMKGIAGHTAVTGEVVNLADVYLDPRFDPTMDKKTNFRTKQMVCVPVYDRPAHVAGVMQCINTPDDQPFCKEDEDLLSIVAKQLGEVVRKQHIGVLGADHVISITRVSATGFSIKLNSVCIKGSHGAWMVTAAIFHGGVRIGRLMRTELVETRKVFAGGERFSEAELDVDLEDSNVRWSCLPVGVRLIINVYGRFRTGLGWAGCNLFTFEHHLRQGKVKLQLFPSACPTPNATALENRDKDASLTVIEFELPTYDKPILYQMPQADIGTTARPEALRGLDIMEEITVKRLIALKNRPTEDEKRLLWKRRLYLAANVPAALPAFLLSVDWSDPDMLTETFKLLYMWEPLPPNLALQLLDSWFPDPRVRAYAVQILARLDDNELGSYMLQLTQVLKLDAFHDSALSRFLLRRALSNPDELGHILFWYLRAEMHNVAISERYGVLLDIYLRNCGSHRALLNRQLSVVQRLDDIACQVREEETRQARLQKLHDLLQESDFGDEFHLPVSPKVLCSGVVVEECRVLESKKKPLLLRFATAPTGQDAADDGKLTVIFKSGDDLRQEQLTLQVLRVMDRLWKAEGLDGCIPAYACVPTGDGTGLIEVVPDAMTVAQIVAEQSHRGAERGGTMTKMAAAYEALSRKDTLVKWLKANNRELGSAADRASVRGEPTLQETQDEQAVADIAEGGAQPEEASLKTMSIKKGAMKQVKRRFMLSCAGYCVATYVLGVGDRHNDNIMVKRSGEMFHIDFGHVLGNFRSKLGFKRGRAPFIFTPAFAEVLGGPDAKLYRDFEDTACKAFLILRRSSTLLITLFSLTLSCGMPELETEDDLLWLKRSLMIDLSEEQASARFKKLIAEALRSKCVLFNDALRLLRHA